MSISVIVAVFNGEKYIAEALDSILAQTLAAKEIIVVDDGSTDQTAAIVKSYPDQVKYFYQPNKGVSAARNRGIQLAQGDYVAFLDHDDIYLATKLDDAYSAFLSHPEADLVVGKWKYCFLNQTLQDSFEQQLRADSKVTSSSEIAGILLGSYLFKRQVFDKVGLFDETLNYAEDVDLIMRTKNANLQEIQTNNLCLLYRYHDTNSTKAANFLTENQHCTLSMLRKSILARRGLKNG